MKKSLFIQILLIVLLLSNAGIIQAQGPETLTREDLHKFSTGKIVRTISATEYIGTPYLTSDWQRGYIMINSRAKSQQLLLRYNTYQNHVEYVEDETLYAVPQNKLAGFVIYTTDGDMTFKNGFQSDRHRINPSTLLRVIYDGDLKLLVHHKTSLKEGVQSYGSATKRKRFVRSDSYYLIDKNDVFHKIELREKDFLSHLKDKADQLKSYAGRKNLSFEKEAHLKVLLQYYERL